jgi:hypothetical protein
LTERHCIEMTPLPRIVPVAASPGGESIVAN